jgi:N-acetylglutamate synthase-like GNAT family acetyltransferase
MNFSLRPATRSDQVRIRSLIRTVRINPTGLDWPRFVVAVTSSGELIGCGQVKTHADGSRELASIAVAPDYRGEGVARAIIEHLINIHPKPLYLTCRSSLEPFYQQFGFQTIPNNQMPPYFRRISRLAKILFWLIRRGEGLAVMQIQA